MKKIIGLVALVLSIFVIQIIVDIYDDKMLIDILSGGANMSTKGYGAYSISTTEAQKVIDSLIELSEQYDMNLTVDNFLETRFDMVIQSDGSILYPQRNVLYHFQHHTKLGEKYFNGLMSHEDFNKLETPIVHTISEPTINALSNHEIEYQISSLKNHKGNILNGVLYVSGAEENISFFIDDLQSSNRKIVTVESYYDEINEPFNFVDTFIKYNRENTTTLWAILLLMFILIIISIHQDTYRNMIKKTHGYSNFSIISKYILSNTINVVVGAIGALIFGFFYFKLALNPLTIEFLKYYGLLLTLLIFLTLLMVLLSFVLVAHVRANNVLKRETQDSPLLVYLLVMKVLIIFIVVGSFVSSLTQLRVVKNEQRYVQVNNKHFGNAYNFQLATTTVNDSTINKVLRLLRDNSKFPVYYYFNLYTVGSDIDHIPKIYISSNILELFDIKIDNSINPFDENEPAILFSSAISEEDLEYIKKSSTFSSLCYGSLNEKICEQTNQAIVSAKNKIMNPDDRFGSYETDEFIFLLNIESPMNFSDLFVVAQSEREQKAIAQEFNNILEDDYGENSLYFTSRTSNLSLDWSRNAFNKILLTNILLSVVIIMNSYLSIKIYFEMQQKRIAVFRLHGYSIHRQYLPQILSYLGLSIVLIIIAAYRHINQIHAIPIQLSDYVITGVVICGIDILLWLVKVFSVPQKVVSTLKNE